MNESTTPTKVCTKYQEEQALDQFGKDPRYKGGHKTWCNKCHREYCRARIHDSPENLERERDRHRASYAANPEKHREKVRRSYQKHRESRLEYNRQYKEKNNETLKQKQQQRRIQQGLGALLKEREDKARSRAKRQGVIYERVDYNAILERDGYFCHICRSVIEPQSLDAIEFDHIIPIEKGGSHTLGNIAVSHLSCNKRKWTKVMDVAA